MKLVVLGAVLLLLNFSAHCQFIIIDETNHCSVRADSLNPRVTTMLDQVVCSPIRRGAQAPSSQVFFLPKRKKKDVRRIAFVILGQEHFDVFTGLRIQLDNYLPAILIGATVSAEDDDD